MDEVRVLGQQYMDLASRLQQVGNQGEEMMDDFEDYMAGIQDAIKARDHEFVKMLAEMVVQRFPNQIKELQEVSGVVARGKMSGINVISLYQNLS